MIDTAAAETEQSEDWGQSEDVGAQLAQIMQAELEEIQEDLDRYDTMSDDGSVLSVKEQNEFEAACSTLAGVTDALEVVRGFKKRLGKRRPKGKGKGGSPAVDANPRRRPTPARGRGNGGKPDGPFLTIAQRKARSVCKACGQKGHWQGDPACPKRSQGANIVDHTVDLEEDLGISDVRICDLPVISDVLVAASNQSLSHPDSGTAILDTAAALTVMGESRWQDYKLRLEALGLDNEIGHIGIDETFRFGDGVAHQCRMAKTFPASFAGHKVTLTACLLPGSLSLLLGRDFTISIANSHRPWRENLQSRIH